MKLTEKNTPLLAIMRSDTVRDESMFWPLRHDIFEDPLDFDDLKGLPEPVARLKALRRMESTAGMLARRHIIENWPSIRKEISSIQAISNPFYDNMSACAEKLWPLLEEFTGETVSGTLVIPGSLTFCYHLTLHDAPSFDYSGYFFILNRNYLMAAFFIDDDGRPAVEYVSCPTVAGDSIPAGKARGKKTLTLKDGDRMHSLSDEELDEMRESLREQSIETGTLMADKFIGTILLYELFRRYANIQTVFSKPYKKVPIPAGDTLMVDSTVPVEYVDCSWFQTIIRTEGFKVRGHFRLQPFGPGKTQKKLIYIDEFQKNGYTRRAKKLLLDPDGGTQ